MRTYAVYVVLPFIVALFVVIAFRYYISRPNFGLPHGSFLVGDKNFEVEIASTIISRVRGLSNRDRLKDNQGMLFIFPQPAMQTFWMKDMRFSIDMVWIRDGKVVDVTRGAPQPPAGVADWNLPRFSPSSPVDMVLEVSAGQAEEIKIGDLAYLTN
jgi:uncharacterized protein